MVCNSSKAGEPQAFVDVFATHVSQDEVFEPVGIVLDEGPVYRCVNLRKIVGVNQPDLTIIYQWY